MKPSTPACLVPPLGPADYRRWRASNVGVLVERLERGLILALIGDVRGRRVLDVGCGDGALAVELGRRGAEVVGVDASAAMIAAACRRARQDGIEIGFVVGDARSLPFAAGSFDLVTAITILCFVGRAAPAFREIARVLRPGGRTVIGELGDGAAGRRAGACAPGSAHRCGGRRGSARRASCAPRRSRPGSGSRRCAAPSTSRAGPGRRPCWPVSTASSAA